MNRKKYKTPQEELGMTDSQIHADMIANGLDPAKEVEKLRLLARSMRSHLPTGYPIMGKIAQISHKRFTLFEESVYAGTAAPSSYGGKRGANIFQILDCANPKDCIWVRVAGDSMKNAGINSEDVLLINTKQTPRTGDIVLVHLAPDGQVVKRLDLRVDGTVILHSENGAYAPIVVRQPELLEIRGVVLARVGVM